MVFGSLAVRVRTDPAWWRDVVVERASEQEIDAAGAERADWDELYPAAPQAT